MQEIVAKSTAVVLGLVGILSYTPKVKSATSQVITPTQVNLFDRVTNEKYGFLTIDENDKVTAFKINSSKSSKDATLLIYEGSCSNLGTIQYVLRGEEFTIREPLTSIAAGPPLALAVENEPLDARYCGELNVLHKVIM